MPQNIVLNLVTQSAIAPVHLQGYSLQQLFLKIVEIVDPVLGHALRRDQRSDFYRLSALQVKPEAREQVSSGREHKLAELADQNLWSIHQSHHTTTTQIHPALTITDHCHRQSDESTLQYAHTSMLSPQTQCWLRISFLDDELFGHLSFLWRQLSNEVFQLGSGSVRLKSVITDTNVIAWARQCSYKKLYEQASSYERNLQIQFVTPTAFKSTNRHTPLPSAQAVFQPLRKCWNRYSELAFTPYLLEHIVPTDFNLHTQSVQHIQNHSIETFTGCLGTINFRIEGTNDPLTIKRINTIADFAQYCSIGQGARFGMGLLKRLNSAAALLEQPMY